MVLHSFLHAAMVANDGVEKLPLLGRIVRSAGTIFVVRYAHGKFIPDAHEQLVNTLNEGRNVAVFPEGTTSNGSGVLPYKNGVLSVMFNNLAKDKLEPHVRAQGFAINVTRVNGQSVAEDPSLRETFAWYGSKNVLRHIWNLLKTKSMDIEIVGLPVLDPADYAGRKEFAAAAEQQVRQAHVPSPAAG
jgi:lyso-ornithine lipid O-acyltransferase